MRRRRRDPAVERVHTIPVPYTMTTGQAWHALTHGAILLHAPPDDGACPRGGGWATVMSHDMVPVAVYHAAREEWLDLADPEANW